jgi:hypothetical protein
MNQKSGDQMLRRYIPEKIADLLQQSAAAASYVAPLEHLLDDPRAQVRFEAACALAKYEAANNPKIFAELTAGLQSSDNFMQLMALETSQKLGPDAVPMFQVVSNYAGSATDLMRDVAFKTLGKIDPNLRYSLPDVDQALKKDEDLEAWNEKGRLGTRSYDDLVAALKDSRLASPAAQQLGEMGPSASAAVPELITALAGQDEASRDQIMEAIHQIDPKAKVFKVDTKTIADAAMAADLWTMQSVDAKPDDALKTILRKAESLNSRWWTRQELTNLVDRIAALDPKACRAFAAKAIEKDPALKDILPPAAFR